MNDVLNQIIEKNHITEEFINAKKMDKENRIFMSDNYVIKIYYPKKFQYYYNELEVYHNLQSKDYLPKLYSYGEESTYKYIVISRLDGKSLFDSWDEYTVDERSEFVKQISNILKDINEIRVEPINFKSILDTKFLNVLSNLNFSGNFISLLQDMYTNNSEFIKTSELGHLIHVDVHFYNFFVNKNKIYAYDFENTMMAPLDYQLLRWYRMWRYPETFIYPKNSLTNQQKHSYETIMPNMLSNYQELCSNYHFEERMKAYLLVYLLEEAKRCNLSEEKVKTYIKENSKIKI